MYALFRDVPLSEQQSLQDRFFDVAIHTEGTKNRPGRPGPGGKLGLITWGTVTVLYNPEPRGAAIRLGVLEQGDFLGALPTFYGVAGVTVETRTGVEIARLRVGDETGRQREQIMRGTLRRLIEACPLVGFNMAGELGWRLLRTNGYLSSSAPDRIRYTIALREIERVGGLANVSDHPDIPPRKDLAAESGITERSVGRALEALTKDRIIEKKASGYAVRSWEELTKGPLTKETRPLYL